MVPESYRHSEAGIQFSAWNLHTRELTAQRMNELPSAISREMRDVRMSKIDVPLHAVTHVSQQPEPWTALQETDESIEVIEWATTVNTGPAGRIRAELECVPEKEEIMVITAMEEI